MGVAMVDRVQEMLPDPTTGRMIQFFDAMGLNEKHLLTQLKRMKDR
jgi:hypothetical protein